MALNFSGFYAFGTLSAGVFSELSGSGYARQAVTLADDGSGRITNTGAMTFGPASAAWSQANAVAIYDAMTGGNMVLCYGLGSSAFVLASGASQAVPAGRMSLTFPASGYTAHGTPIILGEDVAVSGGSIVATPASPPVVSKSGAYTVQASDAGKVLVSSDSAGVTYTLQPGATPGQVVDIVQGGTGAILFAAAAGATVSNRQGFTHSAGQNAAIRVRAITASLWVTTGDLVA